MQVAQLNAYKRNVPKLEASVTVSSELGSAAILSCVVYPKLDQKPCGRAWIALSAGAAAPPNTASTPMQPITAEMVASVQMARCGVRFFEFNMPNFSGASSSLPMAYVTRAPVLMQESVVPIIAKNTVNAS